MSERYERCQIPEEQRCSLEWEDLSYFIPLSAERKAQIDPKMTLEQVRECLAVGDEEERGFPKPTLVQKDQLGYPH